jgi:large subunit ribosomal protein L14e
VDQNRVIVDGPKDLTGVSRQVVNLRQTALTDLVVTLPRNAGEVALRKAITEQGVLTKWNSSAWAQKLARRSTRANLTDFDRFKVVVARRKRADAVRREFSKLKSAAIKSKKL